MTNAPLDITPLGTLFSELAKEYVGIFARSLEHLPINRYFYALVVIDTHKGDLSQTTLGDAMWIDKASVVRMLDYLQDAGCILRTPNPNDRRAHILELTPKARRMIPEIKQAIELTNQICLKNLPGKTAAAFEAELETVKESLQNVPKRHFKLHFVQSEEKNT